MYTYLNRLTSRRRLCSHAVSSNRLDGQQREGFQFLVNVFSILWITRCFHVFVETAAGSRHILVEAAVVCLTGISAFPSLSNAEAPAAERAQGRESCCATTSAGQTAVFTFGAMLPSLSSLGQIASGSISGYHQPAQGTFASSVTPPCLNERVKPPSFVRIITPGKGHDMNSVRGSALTCTSASGSWSEATSKCAFLLYP